MALFVAAWDVEGGPETLLLDANDAEHARSIATEEGEGEAPSRVVPIAPGVFAASVAFEDDEDGNEEVIITPLSHVADLLVLIDDGEAAAAEPATGSTSETCGDEAIYDGEDVPCTLGLGHAGEHEGLTSKGQLVSW